MRFLEKLSIQRPYMTDANLKLLEERKDDLSNYLMQLESDRGRIIQSAAVRRLQQKTQVYPLEQNAAVRSRLTHSMEVMQTGRHIVQNIFQQLGDRAHEYGLDGLEKALESLVEMACLLHDVGNPPFGHFGEAAISRWFEQNLESFPAFAEDDDSGKTLKKELLCDLSSFEGNAQAIRLTQTLLRLNLTYAQAACILKYTRMASAVRPAKDEPLSYLQKKPGYYLSEQQYVKNLQQAVGMKPGHRYPLTYIMEAADDISYCLADIEDGVEKGILTHFQLAELLKEAYSKLSPDAGALWLRPGYGSSKKRCFAEVIDDCLQRAARDEFNQVHDFFVRLRVQLVHPLVRHAAHGFIENIHEIYEGNFNRAILEDDSHQHCVMETFKRVAFEHFFSHPEVETLDLQGHHILTSLLTHYQPLLMLQAKDFQRLLNGDHKGMLIEALLFRRLPNKHIRAYQESVQSVRENCAQQRQVQLWEMYYRCRLIQDMISGMTDQYALHEYRELSALI